MDRPAYMFMYCTHSPQGDIGCVCSVSQMMWKCDRKKKVVQPSVSLTSFLHFDVLLYKTYDKKESIFYVIKRQNVVNGNIINVSVLQSIISKNKFKSTRRWGKNSTCHIILHVVCPVLGFNSYTILTKYPTSLPPCLCGLNRSHDMTNHLLGKDTFWLSCFCNVLTCKMYNAPSELVNVMSRIIHFGCSWMLQIPCLW